MKTRSSAAAEDTTTSVSTAVSTLASVRSSRSHRRSSLSLYPTTSIRKHYEMNEQILQAFDVHVNNGSLRSAYALGVQYCQTALLEIPKHGYYYANRHTPERLESSLQAVRVANALQQMQKDQKFTTRDMERIQHLKDLALEQVQQQTNLQELERQRQETEQKLDDWVVCEPLLACSESWTSILCPIEDVTSGGDEDVEEVRESSKKEGIEYEEVMEPPQLARQDASGAWNRSESSFSSTKRIYPVVEPQSNSQLQPPGKRLDHDELPVSTEDLFLEKALYLSGLEFTETQRSEETKQLEILTLKDLYHQDVQQLLDNGQIRLSLLADTYQGRSSTNGCTVIAPLLCMHHLLDNTLPDAGLPDGLIARVMDEETPAILDELRTSLGLAPQSFLIPSDVHDYFLDRGHLCAEQFVNVIGGNILDQEHVGRLMEALTTPGRRQMGVTLFFHAHVIAILKLQQSNGLWFDILDGLPSKETLRRVNESDQAVTERLGPDAFVPQTARFRCLNAVALETFLPYYACSKFGEKDVQYIDHYEWNDHQSDFDPRVFQAFVWGDAEGYEV